MEKGLNLSIFHLPEKKPELVSPLTLAYIGDAVYELVIRTVITAEHDESVGRLNKRAQALVSANAQSRMAGILLPLLTEEEEAVYRRGRNAKSSSTAKNAAVGDYRRATGFEALMGYLYLKGETERMTELIHTALCAEDEK